MFFFSDFYYDWFITKEFVNNRTGRWFIGVANLAGTRSVDDLVTDETPCSANTLTKDMLSSTFDDPIYKLRTYIGGTYFFNEPTDNWDGAGISVSLLSLKFNCLQYMLSNLVNV